MSRLFLRISAGILVALLISASAVTYLFVDSLRTQWERELPPHVHATANMARTLFESTPLAQADAIARRFHERTRLPVALLTAAQAAKSAKLQSALQRDTDSWMPFYQDEHSGVTGATLLVPLYDRSRLLVLGPYVPPHLPGTGTMLAMVAIVLVVVSITGFLLAAPVVRRLRALETAAANIEQGDLEARAPAAARDAIGELTRRFNAMADEIQGQVERQRQLVQAVAHELRTPIARVRFGVEMMAMAQGTDDRERREAAVVEDLEELDGLVQELLAFSRYDSGRAPLQRTAVDALDRVTRLLDRLRPLHEGHSLTVVAPEPPCPAVHASARAFDRAVGNLVSNGLRYSTSEVRVEVELRPDTLVVAVSDDGPGIPAEDRARVLQPFARLDASRNRGSGGVGLGLAIVARILSAHGGTLHIEDASEGGLGGARVVTEWPLASERA